MFDSVLNVLYLVNWLLQLFPRSLANAALTMAEGVNLNAVVATPQEQVFKMLLGLKS